MMVIKKMCTLIAFVILLSFASGEEAKGSLTFVIDDTSSMQPDIDQVKEKTSDIFAAVQNSNASQMDEFIIVTFNDPYFDFRIKTNDSDLFTKALIGIQPGGGGDCPEMAMAGIQEALEHSKRNSFLYVFTDASAVDYDQYENVKSLAQQKSIQVNFLLTGECEDDSVEQHLVYDHLAAATSGQVFHIDKDDISKIIEYILANLRNKRIILLHKTYEYTRRCNNLKFTVDSKVWEILIALSASRPLYYSELIVYGPGGTKESIQDFIITENTIIVKMQGKAGEYVIEIIDCEGITIVVSAATSVSFSHGFSPIKPSSLDETSTKPVPGTQSYLAIALTNEERDITLKTVEIRDTDDNLIPPELPLKLVDNDKQFYITNLFTPPTKTFTIAVIGYTKLNEKITRVSQTSIEYHTPLPGVYTAPTVTVLGPKKVPGDNQKSVSLKCKVTGFPKPEIWWEDEFHIKSDKDKLYEIAPNEYLIVLLIIVSRTVTFTCKAKNFRENSDNVTVTVQKAAIVTILEGSELTVYNNQPITLNCKVEGFPEPAITWEDQYQNVLPSQIKAKTLPYEYISTFHINKATVTDSGTYICKAKNFKDDSGSVKVTIIKKTFLNVLEYPKDMSVEYGKSVELHFKINAQPPANIIWYLDDKGIRNDNDFDISLDSSVLKIKNAQPGLQGKYYVKASNVNDQVKYEFHVTVTGTEVPRVNKHINSYTKHKGSSVDLECRIMQGKPKPVISWSFDRNFLGKITNLKDTGEFIRIDHVTNNDVGTYRCDVVNVVGLDHHEMELYIEYPPTVKLNPSKVISKKGDRVLLACDVDGSPTPNVRCCDKNYNVKLDKVQAKDEGFYRCTADNGFDKDEFTYTVNIQAFPTTNELPLTITIIEGNQKPMHCGLSLDKGFLVRWFKDGVFIKEGDLTLTGVTKAHAGYYICRVNTPGRSYTFPKNVIVGTPPKFITAGSPTVMFKDGAVAKLDCSATGEPAPRTTWWRDHTKIDVDLSQYSFIMDVNNIGQMMCHVSNEFDTIKRSFDFIAEECLMNIENDFTARQPILIAGYKKREWPVFKVSGGTLRMRKQKNFKLFCPNSFISYGSSNYGNDLKISCAGDSLFELGKRAVKASDITCNQPVFPVARNLSVVKCLGHDTKILHVGFDVDGAPMNVFRVCFNEKTNMTLYAMHSMHKAIAHTIPKHVAGYTRGTTLSFEFDEIYDCGNQVNAISPFTSEKCCFKRRQLVNPMDVLPGISQVATYHYLNVVPQWSSCGTENWDEVERRVRLYALNSDDKIFLWTGAAYSVKSNIPAINLRDKLNQELQVPQFIWRVVERQFVIIHVNIPGLTLPQALTYVLCYDICDTIPWMKNPHWHDVDKGFIYCCYVDAFENAFNYQGIFYKDRFSN
nr:hemicentin-1-like [Maniola hyperantus]